MEAVLWIVGVLVVMLGFPVMCNMRGDQQGSSPVHLQPLPLPGMPPWCAGGRLRHLPGRCGLNEKRRPPGLNLARAALIIEW